MSPGQVSSRLREARSCTQSEALEMIREKMRHLPDALTPDHIRWDDRYGWYFPQCISYAVETGRCSECLTRVTLSGPDCECGAPIGL